MRKLICLFVAVLFSCSVRQHKPDAKIPDSRIEENWIVRDPFPSATLAANIILENTIWEIEGVIPRESWRVVEDVQPSTFKIKDLEFVSFFKDDESYITGRQMRSRAAFLHGNLGLVDAKYLRDYQADIPAVWQYYYIVFPGTVLQSSFNHGFYVPVLYWSWWINGWDLYFAPLGGNWYRYRSMVWTDAGCVVIVK